MARKSTPPKSTPQEPAKRSKVTSTPIDTPAPPEPTPMKDFGEEDEFIVEVPEVEGDAAPETPEAGGSPTPAPVTHLSPFLVAMAKRFGFSEQDLKDMSQREVERFIEHAHRRDLEMAEMISRQQAQAGQPGAGVSTPSPAPAPAAAEDEFDPELSDEYPAELKGALKKAATARDKKIAALEAELAKVKGHTQATREQAILKSIDDAFEALGPGYHEYFGKGAITSGQLTNEEAQRRGVLVRMLTPDDTPASIREKFQATAHALYGAGKAPASKAETALEQAKVDYVEGKVTRPAQRDPALPPHGRERAIRSNEAMMRKKGMLPSYATNGDGAETEL